ncbi:SCO family protein [Xenophilus arseniciresistens]|uniref:SCO family protein n=1 Tax=Xenophilus arseniciresistens TaxID=1283306 RepID=A0AAE3N834_9BURK|nr:SCO family protein [Xenophilus arseniciresistens]MDA7416821.1 SCO family protein [Xenophilus arseniciresistens]
MNKRQALRLLTGGAGALAVLGLAACSESKPSFNAIDLTGADYARDFKLADMNGRERTLADFKGKVVAVFFGFAQCPDVCPTTMLEMKQIKDKLGADGDKLQVIYITVDPARDTAAVMKDYMAAFDPSFLALIPTPEQLAATAKDFKVYYKKVDGKTPGSYTMDHSAASYLYDPQGRLRLYARYGTPVDALAADIQTLLKQG